MRKLLLTAIAILTLVASTALAADPLMLKIIRWEHDDGSDYSHMLMAVTNSSDKSYYSAEWSCVRYDGDDPVFEERVIVQAIPANDRTMKREITKYTQFTSVTCRLIKAMTDEYQNEMDELHERLPAMVDEMVKSAKETVERIRRRTR